MWVRADLTRPPPQPLREGTLQGMSQTPLPVAFFDRLIAQAVEKQTKTPVDDFHNFGRIRGWAETVLA